MTKKKPAEYVNIHIFSLEKKSDIYVYIPKELWSSEDISDMVKDAIDSTFKENEKPTELNS